MAKSEKKSNQDQEQEKSEDAPESGSEITEKDKKE